MQNDIDVAFIVLLFSFAFSRIQPIEFSFKLSKVTLYSTHLQTFVVVLHARADTFITHIVVVDVKFARFICHLIRCASCVVGARRKILVATFRAL